MDKSANTKLTADDYVVEPTMVLQITNITEGADDSSGYRSIISADGSTVFFSSWADNLVDGQEGWSHESHIFLHDVATGETVSIFPHAWGNSFISDISADGSTMVFSSNAGNLVEGEEGAGYAYDLFVHDVGTGETVNITQGALSYGAAISADGSTVAIMSGTPSAVEGEGDRTDVVLYDVAADEAVSITQGGDGSSYSASFSVDGSTLAFTSNATNLVKGETDANGVIADVFLYDVATGKTVNLTQGGNGNSYGLSISADGSWGEFTSNAPRRSWTKHRGRASSRSHRRCGR
jgi:Tol biopolymer transport system component